MNDFLSRKKHLFLLLIFLVAGALRVGSIHQPHASIDEMLYLALGVKIKHEGFSEYNLRHVNLQIDETGTVAALRYKPDLEHGTLLQLLKSGGAGYYSKETLTNMPPLFSTLLMASHAVLGSSTSPDAFLIFRNVDKNLNALLLSEVDPVGTQIYATWLNIALSLLVIWLTFLAGKILYDERVGLVAALLMTLNPVDLLASQRVWADPLLTACVTLSALLLLLGKERKKLWLLGLAGIACGLAILTKGSGLFLLGLGCIWLSLPFLFSKARGRCVIEVFSFVAPAILVAMPWHLALYQHYGTFLYMPDTNSDLTHNPWFQMLAERKRWGQWVYFLVLLPVLAFAYLEPVRLTLRNLWSHARFLPIILVFGFLLLLTYAGAKEERYLLPVHPFICILSTAFLTALIPHLKKRSQLLSRGGAVVIVASTIVSVCLTMRWVWEGKVIFPLF